MLSSPAKYAAPPLPADARLCGRDYAAAKKPKDAATMRFAASKMEPEIRLELTTHALRMRSASFKIAVCFSM